MSKIVIRLGRVPLQATHHNILRRLITEAAKQQEYDITANEYDTEDNRADYRLVSNHAEYITQSYNLNCSNIDNPLLPRIIGYRIAETDAETQQEIERDILIAELTDDELETLDKSNPIFEQVIISQYTDDDGVEHTEYGIQPVIPFEMHDDDFLILIGNITDFNQVIVERSDALLLTY